MRKIFQLTIALLSAASLAACSGSGDDSPTPSPGEGYTISVDKTEIEADGIDEAVFTVKDSDGTVVSTEANMSRIYFKNVVTEERLERLSTSFTSLENGTFEFIATVGGEETVNSVTITAKNRAKYETFFRRVAGYKLTGTWCAACPLMTAGVAGLNATVKEHFLELAFHAGSSGSSDPWAIPVGNSDLGTYLLTSFGGQGYPSLLYDLDVISIEKSSSGIAKLILEQRSKYPATSGIRIESSYADGVTRITAGLKSSKGGEYDLGYALLLDNQIYTPGTATDGIYNNIVVGCSGNFMTMGDAAFTVGADEEHTVEFTVTGSISGEMLPNLRVAVFSLRRDSGKTIIDNITACPLGSGVDYEYNE